MKASSELRETCKLLISTLVTCIPVNAEVLDGGDDSLYCSDLETILHALRGGLSICFVVVFPNDC